MVLKCWLVPLTSFPTESLTEKTCVTLCCNIKPKATDSWLMSLCPRLKFKKSQMLLVFTSQLIFFLFLKGPKLYKFHLALGLRAALLLGRDQIIEIWVLVANASFMFSEFILQICFYSTFLCISCLERHCKNHLKKKYIFSEWIFPPK